MDTTRSAFREWVLFDAVVAFGLYWASNLLLWFPWSVSALLGMTLMLTVSPLLWAYGTYQCLIRDPSSRPLCGAVTIALVFTVTSAILDFLFFGLIRGAMQELYHPTTLAGYGFLLVLPFAEAYLLKRRIRAKKLRIRRREFLLFGGPGLLFLLAIALIIGFNIEV